MTVTEYLELKYQKTKWPFFSEVEVLNKFKGCNDELNQLFKDGKIRVRKGLNGRLIELITEKWILKNINT